MALTSEGSSSPLFGAHRAHRKTPKASHPPKTANRGEERVGVSFPHGQVCRSLRQVAGHRAETYFGFQQVIKGFMVWWVWSIVRASRSQWRAQSWRKRGSLQRQREGSTGGSCQNNVRHSRGNRPRARAGSQSGSCCHVTGPCVSLASAHEPFAVGLRGAHCLRFTDEESEAQGS